MSLERKLNTTTVGVRRCWRTDGRCQGNTSTAAAAAAAVAPFVCADVLAGLTYRLYGYHA